MESLGIGDGLVLVKATEVTELTPLPSRVPHHLGEHCLGALSAKSNPFMSLWWVGQESLRAGPRLKDGPGRSQEERR